MLTRALDLGELEQTLIDQAAEVEEGAHGIGEGDMGGTRNRAVLQAKLSGLGAQFFLGSRASEGTQQQFEQAASQVAVAIARGLIEVSVPGEVSERAVGKGEADASQYTLYKELSGGT